MEKKQKTKKKTAEPNHDIMKNHKSRSSW